MMKNIFGRIKNNRLVTDTTAILGLGILAIAPLMIKLIMLVIGVVFVFWILNNLVSIGIGLMVICIPIFLMIVGAVLVKKYLLRQKEGATS